MEPAGRLCAIVDVEVAERAAWSPIDLATAYLNGGARFLQLRAKSLSGSAFLDLAFGLQHVASEASAILIVNDRADIARISGARGVHVGQEDLSPLAVRTIVGTEAMVGLSTHTEAQIDAALQQPIDYIAIGPVFGTSTKSTGYAAVGIERVRVVAAHASRCQSRPLPVVAIGGITLDSASGVIAAGATAVAVIADLLATGDPEARTRAYLARLG